MYTKKSFLYSPSQQFKMQRMLAQKMFQFIPSKNISRSKCPQRLYSEWWEYLESVFGIMSKSSSMTVSGILAHVTTCQPEVGRPFVCFCLCVFFLFYFGFFMSKVSGLSFFLPFLYFFWLSGFVYGFDIVSKSR